ncbi:hypothetical protein G6016_04620, partial [Dietzia aerolata]|nr:hypothetical protein [Dietzia aerolata]
GPAAQPVVDAAAEIFTAGLSDSLLALGLVAAGAAVLLLFIAPGRGYVPQGDAGGLGDADTDAEASAGVTTSQEAATPGDQL